jgi:hypothetical protein
MSAVSAPFGFRPAYHPTGLDRARRYTIAGSYGTVMYKGSMVTLNTNGTVTAAAAAADFLGILAGVEFVDANGKPNLQPYWPASQAILAGTTAYAWVWDDPLMVFEAQANGAVAQTAVGDQTDVVNVSSGSAQTGLSTSGLNSSLAGAASQGQWAIRGFSLDPNNAVGDAFTIVQVTMARSINLANKVAV